MGLAELGRSQHSWSTIGSSVPEENGLFVRHMSSKNIPLFTGPYHFDRLWIVQRGHFLDRYYKHVLWDARGMLS